MNYLDAPHNLPEPIDNGAADANWVVANKLITIDTT
jgi:hypothetical protein